MTRFEIFKRLVQHRPSDAVSLQLRVWIPQLGVGRNLRGAGE